MNLDDMVEPEVKEFNPEITALTTSMRSDADVLRDWRKGCIVHQASEEDFKDGRKIVIVETEEGNAEYAIMYPDGHIGTILDYDGHLGSVRD